MAYVPSIKDIDTIGYEPQLEDLPASEQLQSMANQQGNFGSLSRYIYPHEEFSNPTINPGFQKLPQEEQLRRISLSQFDPANQSPTGQFVPPGTYEHPVNKMLAEGAAYATIPIAPFETPLLNSLHRITTSGALGTAFNQIDPENKQSLGENARTNFLRNSLIEGMTSPLRLANSAANVINPKNFANAEINNIKNNYQSAIKQQEEYYNHPSITQYNNSLVTFDPQKYLDDIGIKRKKLLPEAKGLYDNFLSDPSYKNLQPLQSQINRDAYNMTKTKPYTKADLTQWGKKLKKDTKSFLGINEEALENYEKGDAITRDIIKPYEATPSLRKILSGKISEAEPNQLQKYIRTALQTEKSKIPNDHYLRQSLEQLNSRISRGELISNFIPPLVKLPFPNMTGVIQNKYLSDLLKKTEKPYYALSRTLST